MSSMSRSLWTVVMVMLSGHSTLSCHTLGLVKPSCLWSSGGGTVMSTEWLARVEFKGSCYHPASRWQQPFTSQPGPMRAMTFLSSPLLKSSTLPETIDGLQSAHVALSDNALLPRGWRAKGGSTWAGGSSLCWVGHGGEQEEGPSQNVTARTGEAAPCNSDDWAYTALPQKAFPEAPHQVPIPVYSLLSLPLLHPNTCHNCDQLLVSRLFVSNLFSLQVPPG